jgi:hypothetical protein
MNNEFKNIVWHTLCWCNNCCWRIDCNCEGVKTCDWSNCCICNWVDIIAIDEGDSRPPFVPIPGIKSPTRGGEPVVALIWCWRISLLFRCPLIWWHVLLLYFFKRKNLIKEFIRSNLNLKNCFKDRNFCIIWKIDYKYLQFPN